MQSKASKPLGRRVWAWSLYDFANSSFAVLFGAMFAVYYTEDVVSPYYVNVVGKPVEGEGDLWWGGTIALSMLLVAFSSPFMGGIADHTGRRKRILAFYTAVGVVAVFALMFVGPGGLGMVLMASALAALANIAFEGGLVFYNAYLPDIAPPDQRGRVSALGFAVGTRGADHNRSSAYEVDFSDRVDRRAVSPAAAPLAVATENKAALLDSLILCKFLRGVFDDFYGEAAEMLNLVTGWDTDSAELTETAARIAAAKKLFNIRAGWTAAEDTLPSRFFAAPPSDDP